MNVRRVRRIERPGIPFGHLAEEGAGSRGEEISRAATAFEKGAEWKPAR